MEDKTNAYVRQHQRNLDNERANTMTTTAASAAPVEEPKSPKSSLVIAALIFLIAAFVLGTIAAIFVLPYIAVFAVIDGLAAVTLAILSLRETA